MGDRAVITTANKPDAAGIYLHWHGEPEYVEAFLKYCELKGYREPDKDSCGFARLAQVVANYIDGQSGFWAKDGVCIAVDAVRNLCGWLNHGIYVIEGWRVKERVNEDGTPFDSSGEAPRVHTLRELLHAINDAQPKASRIGQEHIDRALDDPAFDELSERMANGGRQIRLALAA